MTMKTGASVLLALATAITLTAQPAASPPPGPVEQLLTDIKKPTPWLTWGGDLRIRNEYFNNVVSLSDAGALQEQDVVRFRGRVWAAATPITNFSVNLRLSAEPREWIKPSFVRAYSGRLGMEWRYGILDTANVRWENIMDQPLSLTIGRQDIQLGDFYDWWLVSDGTPGDGSWTFFLDAARLTYEMQPIQTKLDLIYIYQNPTPDDWIPTLGRSSDYQLTEQREQGVVVYASNKSIKNVQLDGYFMYKRDDRETFRINGVEARPGDNAEIYTVGGKVTGTPLDHWQYSLEGAYQFGHKNEVRRNTAAETDPTTQDIDAYGAKTRLSYLFKDKLKNQVSLIGEFLSGDDPSTGNDEMFDLLWGRWPRWSELYIYSYIHETDAKVAQMNNLGRVGVTWSINPANNTTFSAAYNALLAPEGAPSRPTAAGQPFFSNDGHFRGHYLQTVLKYQFNKHINAHLWGEWIWEGDYYAQRDLMMFLRAEVMLSF